MPGWPFSAALIENHKDLKDPKGVVGAGPDQPLPQHAGLPDLLDRDFEVFEVLVVCYRFHSTLVFVLIR